MMNTTVARVNSSNSWSIGDLVYTVSLVMILEEEDYQLK